VCTSICHLLVLTRFLVYEYSTSTDSFNVFIDETNGNGMDPPKKDGNDKKLKILAVGRVLF